MTNAIYTGHVAHGRPGKHRLRYRVFMLALDVDALPVLGQSLRWFSHNRANLISVHDRDHAGRVRAGLRAQIETKLYEADIVWDGGPITLLAMPRILNYVFNPLSVYFCQRRDGSLAALVHEVSNTFGERHFYVLPPRRAGEEGSVVQACDKAFFVSPFLEANLRYEFLVTPPGGDMARVAMIVKRGEEIALTASFSGKRSDLTDANLLRAWAGNPAMTLAVIAGIHWEALKMWTKGVRYLGRPRSAPLSRSAPDPTRQPPMSGRAARSP